MTCFHPRYIWLKDNYPVKKPSEEDMKRLNKASFKPRNGYYCIQIPCGNCIGCKLDHASEWAVRCSMELKTFQGEACFITLTYNNKSLPLNEKGEITLKEKDVVDFLKRLRKKEKGKYTVYNPISKKYENSIRYFYCGEYGPTTGRPHYHMIIFNWKPNDLRYWKTNKKGVAMYKSKMLQNTWGNGFITVQDCNFNTSAYTARYTLKKAGLQSKRRDYYYKEEIDFKTGEIKIKKKFVKEIHDKEPEYIRMSRMPGIGWYYWNENKTQIKRDRGVWIQQNGTGKLKRIPRYMRKKWEEENWPEYYRFKYNEEKRSWESLMYRINQINWGTKKHLILEQKIDILLKENERRLKEKMKLYTRDEGEEDPDDY